LSLGNIRVKQLATLFPPSVSLAVAAPDLDAPLQPEEDKLLRQAVEARRREFALGRAAARQALAGLGAPLCAIPMQADRSPAWPEGFIGSITHCNGFCGAAVARQSDLNSIGFDAEPALPLPEGTDRIIYGAEEAAHFSALPVLAGVDWAKLAFCAKEAFYKCFFPVARRPLGFREAQVRFTADNTFAITSGAAAAFLDGKVQGRWLVQDGLVFTSFVKR
jgi:4'-phosphopantetheinyl transferase EntD